MRFKGDKPNNKLFDGISLRTKMIMFLVLSLIVAGIAYKAAVDNRSSNKSIIEKIDNGSSNNNNVESFIEDPKKDSTETDEAKKLKEEKSKKLEDMYQQSYKAFGEKKYQETIKLADQMIGEDSSFYKAYNIKGIAQCYNNNFNDGMKNIDKSLEIRPDFGYARFNKALAYELYGYYDDSLKWYDKALEVEDYIWSYYGKASIYGRRGDIENTVKYLKTAIDMAPEIKKLASEETDFNPVKNSKEFQELIK
ncbi:hypothetical protein P8V03_03030 [Clostridium sp. A1-XYC3]|uniref:Tetratricopeptide repeat protein n=1 Tax=Clostridium tanneri TaxID=3037988 RepID=A0ABU4JPS8_9CLOT|nr:hypothetical protein [Clostridium sp. A1-XYC3]MDW8800125.1 hypothetical protein [Clostridium sp. A1-XYC3]